MSGLVLALGSAALGSAALGTSDDAAHGYNLTFAFPMLLLIVVGGALYLAFTRPHRVPGRGPRPVSGNVAPDELQAAAAGPEPDVSPAADAAPADGASHEDEATE
jgi:hypothetical protein